MGVAGRWQGSRLGGVQSVGTSVTTVRRGTCGKYCLPISSIDISQSYLHLVLLQSPVRPHLTMAATSEEKLVTMAENYYLDLRGSFDESIDKVAGSGGECWVGQWMLFSPGHITQRDYSLGIVITNNNP